MAPPPQRLERSILTGLPPQTPTAKDASGRPIKFDPPTPVESPKWASEMLEAINQNADALREVLDKGLPVAKSSTEAYRTIQVAMPLDAPWVLLDLIAPSVDLSVGDYSAAYLVEPGGRVSLRGAVSMAAVGDIVTLPVGARPGKRIGFLVEAGGGPDVGTIRVETTGIVTLAAGPAFPNIFMEAVRFIAPSARSPNRFMDSGWPMVVRHGFPKPVTGLQVVRCRPKTPVGTEAMGHPALDWEDMGDGTLKIHAVWGLSWGRVYDVRVLFSTED